MKEITVYADWLGTPSILKMGTLRVENSKSEEAFFLNMKLVG